MPFFIINTLYRKVKILADKLRWFINIGTFCMEYSKIWRAFDEIQTKAIYERSKKQNADWWELKHIILKGSG